LKKFDKALIDFQNVINLQPHNGSGYIGLADSMKGLGNFKGALHSYNQAI
jgi:Flp pilus assembly protein TadD